MQNRKRDTDVQNRILDSVGEGEGGMFQENSIETCILSRVKQITSPGWMHETSARAWCTGRPRGIRWRGRWEGGSSACLPHLLLTVSARLPILLNVKSKSLSTAFKATQILTLKQP